MLSSKDLNPEPIPCPPLLLPLLLESLKKLQTLFPFFKLEPICILYVLQLYCHATDKMGLTHRERWQRRCQPRGWSATCSVKAVYGTVGMVVLLETRAFFLISVLLFQVIYIQGALQDSSQHTAGLCCGNLPGMQAQTKALEDSCCPRQEDDPSELLDS